MAEASTPQPPPEQLPWGISYLREDIQDLRNEVRNIHSRIDETARYLSDRIDARFASLVTTIVAIGGVIISLVAVVIAMVKG
jgi:CHASE3 domain sensor protein